MDLNETQIAELIHLVVTAEFRARDRGDGQRAGYMHALEAKLCDLLERKPVAFTDRELASLLSLVQIEKLAGQVRADAMEPIGSKIAGAVLGRA